MGFFKNVDICHHNYFLEAYERKELPSVQEVEEVLAGLEDENDLPYLEALRELARDQEKRNQTAAAEE